MRYPPAAQCFLGLSLLSQVVLSTTCLADGPAAKFPVTLTLGPNKELHLASQQPSGAITRNYTAGDRIKIDFAHGVFSIDGVPYRPQSPPPLPTYSIEFIRQHYGQVPMVADSARLDTASVERWNISLRAWESALDSLLGRVGDQYRAERSKGVPRSSARALAVDRLKASPLIESARLGTFNPSLTEYPHEPLIFYRPRGQRQEVRLEIAEKALVPRRASDPCELEDALDTLRILEHLAATDSRHVLIELRFGTLHYQENE